MLRELSNIGDQFVSLDGELSKLTAGFVNEEVMPTCLEKLLSGAEAPHNPKRVPNPTVLVAAYEWRVINTGNVRHKLVLASDEGKYLLLGEKGLCFGPESIPAGELFVKTNFTNALPAKVNPRPRKATEWNYAIPLANGYELRVRLDEANGVAACRFGIHRVKGMKESTS